MAGPPGAQCRRAPDAAPGRAAQAAGAGDGARALDQLVVREDVAGRAVADDPAAGHHDRPGRVVGDELHVVRHDDDGATLVAQIPQEREQLVGTCAVLTERRLIEDEDAGARDQGGHNREAALLAAGEEEGVRAPLRSESEPFEQRVGALADLRLGEVLPSRAVRDLVEHRVCDELMFRILEDEADAGGQCARVGSADVQGAHPHRAARGPPHTRDRLDEGRLSRAVRAHDGHELAFVDREVDVMEHRGAPPPHGESADVDERTGPRLRVRRQWRDRGGHARRW